MQIELHNRIRIEGSEIGIVRVLSLESHGVKTEPLDPRLPVGIYIELEFISTSGVEGSIAKYPAVVVQSSKSSMAVQLENMNDVYIKLLSLWHGTGP